MARVLLVVVLSLGATVSRSPFCVGAELAQQQVPPMPPPGNPDHQAPEKRAFCSRSKDAAHTCKCHAKCIVDDKGNVTGVEEDPKCRAWCFRDHCRCPADCE
jgi:hypothetical protein